MAVTLYSADSSYYSMIARLALAEKGVNYDLHKIDIHIKMEQFSPEYIKIQPNMTVPALVYNGKAIDDSRRIMEFVNKEFPGPDLCPEADTAAIQQSLDLHYGFSIEDLTMGNTARKSPLARKILPMALNRASKVIRKLILSHPEFKESLARKLKLEEQRRLHIFSRENNFEQVQAQAIELCDKLEQQLGITQFAASNNYSLADVVWTVFIGRLYMIHFNHLIESRKNLHAYWKRMQQRESFAKADIWTKMPAKVLIRLLFGLVFKI